MHQVCCRCQVEWLNPWYCIPTLGFLLELLQILNHFNILLVVIMRHIIKSFENPPNRLFFGIYSFWISTLNLNLKSGSKFLEYSIYFKCQYISLKYIFIFYFFAFLDEPYLYLAACCSLQENKGGLEDSRYAVRTLQCFTRPCDRGNGGLGFGA